MSTKQNYQDYRSELLGDRAFAVEAAKGELIMAVTESICELLENENMTRKELADEIAKTKGFVSQLLNGSRNMTLSTLSEIAYALGYTPTISFEKSKTNKYLLGLFEVDMSADKCIYEARTKAKVA
ncbi:MAG: helix-turn-helix transcriptional regulator [Syntrophobacteraceae bacterium]